MPPSPVMNGKASSNPPIKVASEEDDRERRPTPPLEMGRVIRWSWKVRFVNVFVGMVIFVSMLLEFVVGKVSPVLFSMKLLIIESNSLAVFLKLEG